MPEPLFATFSASYAFLQNSCCKVTPHFPPVLKAVGDRFRRAVDTNRDSIDLRIDDSLRERLAGKSNKAQLQAIDNRFFGFAIDGHPNVTRIRRENAVPGECRLKAHNTVGYSQAREGDLMFEIRRKISAGIQTAADLDEQSPARLCSGRGDGHQTDTARSLARQPVSRQSKRAASWTVVFLPSGSPQRRSCCYRGLRWRFFHKSRFEERSAY